MFIYQSPFLCQEIYPAKWGHKTRLKSLHSNKSRHSRESGNPVISKGSGSPGQETVSQCHSEAKAEESQFYNI